MFAILALSGCVSHLQKLDIIKLVPLSNLKKQPQKITSEVVPQPPKIQQFDWFIRLQPLVDQLIAAKEVTAGSLLLVDSVKNNTNGILQTAKATCTLRTAIESNPTFILVPEARLINARHALGLSLEDNYSSRSMAVLLARIVNAQYVLYSDFSGDVKLPMIDMQLILVKTGEIIWSGNNKVKL